MEKIELNGQIIEYILQKKKIKNSYITIKDSIVTVKVPMKTSDLQINDFLTKRADWIINTIEKQKKSAKLPKKYINDEVFRVLGKDTVLNISYENTKKSKLKYWLNKFNLIIPISEKGNTTLIAKKLIDNFYSELAEKEVERAMRKITMKVGLAPNKYTVKNLKSTWGNCSTTGNISISKNVVMYSRHAIEYVCLHEICHLQHMNHSKLFWNMVLEYMPDYKDAEIELRN